MTRHDFTEAGARNPSAKQETREKPLELLRGRSSVLWSRKHQGLRYDWMELAGTRAPTLQMLLDERALAPGARFIGVDTSKKVLGGCRRHYGDGVPAEWVQGSLIPKIRDAVAYPQVGVLVYDSFRSVRGQAVESDLRVLARFARSQADRIGEFLLVINVSQSRFTTDEDVSRYQEAVSAIMGFTEVDLHRYISKRNPMFWTALRFGF